MGFSLSGSQLLPLLSGRRAHQSQLSHFLAFRLEAKKRIVAVSLGIYVSQPMSSFRSIKQKCQQLWTCSFIPPSPKLLAQQKKKKNQDCCRCRGWTPKRFLQCQRSQSLSLPFPLCSKTFECKDISREAHLNTGFLFSGWQQKPLTPSMRSKGKRSSSAQPCTTLRQRETFQ